MGIRQCGTGRQRGNAILEFAITAFLMGTLSVSAIDAGVYLGAFVAVQNAARAAVLRNSGGQDSAADQVTACSVAIDQMRGFPGVASNTSCLSSSLIVSSVYCAGQRACGNRPDTADSAAATLVTVRYTPPSVFRIPLTQLHTISATAEMKIRSFQ